MDNPFYGSGNLWIDGLEVSFARASREPCPVCGHATGDCSGTLPPPEKIAGFNTIESLVSEQTFFLEEDIFEDRQITPFTKARVLKYAKGKHIPLQEARNLGLA
jgi:hypothetical protein